mmetsp:Transcript_26559/g.52154  ORF Transcript_26559/g.52154 Transcript_26559/m.52154 type:complete len:101 (+) Transcript_26559:1834-2136(+)
MERRVARFLSPDRRERAKGAFCQRGRNAGEYAGARAHTHTLAYTHADSHAATTAAASRQRCRRECRRTWAVWGISRLVVAAVEVLEASRRVVEQLQEMNR